MAWVKLESNLFSKPAMLELSKDAKLFYIACMCHISEFKQTSDTGEIPVGSMRGIAERCGVRGGWLRLTDELIVADLVADYTDTFMFYEWELDFKVAAQKESRGYESTKWRKAVLDRDGHKCTSCGVTSDLHAHHIKPWALYPEQRFDLDNGTTLCSYCHTEVHRSERKGA